MENIIAYTVNKSFNNELYLSVQNGEVLVEAPWYYTNTQVKKIIEEKKQWILNKIQEYKIQEEKKYIRNEVVKILGKNCKVIINYKNLKKPTLTVEGKNIKIFLPNKYKKMGREEILTKLIEKLYDLLSSTELEPIMEKVRKQMRIAPEDYKIERINGKIAECYNDEKIIVINPDIVKYDKETIEYILIHEFCHLKFKTHSKGFNEMIRKYVSNIEKYNKILEEIRI